MKKIILLFLILFCVKQGKAQIGAALSFDGVDDIVSMATTSAANNLCPSGFTMEAWIFPRSASSAHSIIRKTGDYNLFLYNGNLYAEIWPLGTSSTTWKQFSGTAPLTMNVWSHVAFTWDGTTGLLYVNGSVIASGSLNSTVGGSETLHLGASAIFGNPLLGSLDEVRIWNTVRTKCQINTFKDCEIATTASGLVANYHFNQGVAGSSNSGITSLNDASSNSYTGTLSNFALTGTTSNWVAPGGVVSGSVTPLASFSITASVTNSLICNGQTTTLNGSGASTYTWTGGATNGVSFSPTVTSIYSVTGTSTAGCTSTNVASVSVTVTPSNVNPTLPRPQGSGYAINFDGVNDVINMGASPLVNNLGLGSFAMEAWIFPTSTVGVRSIIRKDGDFDLYLNGGVLSAEAWTTGGNFTLAVGTSVALNQWSHVAAVWNGSAYTLFINGTAVSSSVSNLNNGAVSNLNIGASTNFAQYFSGMIDEVRIWNTSLTQTEIRDWMCKKIKSSHSKICNLRAYYRFDESTGTTASDYMNTHNGTLANGPVRVVSGAPIGDNAIWLASATVSSTVSLAHPSGDNLKATLTAGTANLMAVYSVDTIPNVTTPPGTFNQLSRVDYFGVKLFGSTGGVYSVLYDYTGHVGIANEATLGLASRSNNSALSWTEETSAVLNTTANTLLLGGQTGTEFILASRGGNSLPIELIYFKAELNSSNTIDLTWATASEINNDYFMVQHSKDGYTWENLNKVDAHRTTVERNNYSDTDLKPFDGVTYYRLKQVDFNETYTYSNIETIELNLNRNLLVKPNPFTQLCSLQLEGTTRIQYLEVFNVMGDIVKSVSIESEQKNIELDFSYLPSGIYYIKADGVVLSQKLIKQ